MRGLNCKADRAASTAPPPVGADNTRAAGGAATAGCGGGGGGTAASTSAGAPGFSMPTGSRGPFVRGRGSLSATAAESAARASRGRCAPRWGPVTGTNSSAGVPNLRALFRPSGAPPQPGSQASSHWTAWHCCCFFLGLSTYLMAAHSARQCLRCQLLEVGRRHSRVFVEMGAEASRGLPGDLSRVGAAPGGRGF